MSLGTPFSPPQAQNLSQREIGTSSWDLSKPRFSERIFWRSWGVIVSPASRKGSFWNPQLRWRGAVQKMPELMFERFVGGGTVVVLRIGVEKSI